MKKDGAPQSERPTYVRHMVVGAAALMAMLLYLDRICISFAGTFIQEDLGLSDQQLGWMLSAFFWSYALCQVPSGWLSDRFGPRTMLVVYILLWSLFTALTGASIAFAMVLALRLGFGVAQAGAYPTAGNIVSKWVPHRGRGFASGLVAVGGRVGGFLAFVLTGFLIVWLVPASGGSQLAEGDLLDARALCRQIADGEDRAPLGEALNAGLSPGARWIANELADDPLPKEGELPSPIPAAEVAHLRAELNAAIEGKALVTAKGIEGTSIEETLEGEGRRILETPVAKRTPAETQRLNRLVLEAAYPDAIRKVYGRGWRSMMLIYGLIGLPVAALFWFVFRNRPRQHPWANDAESRLIESGRPKGAAQPEGEVRFPPLLPLATNFSMWMCCVCQFMTNMGWVVLVTWAPRYFETVHRVPVEERSWMTALPPLIGWFGMLLGGFVTDRIARRVGLRWGRALPLALSRFTAMGAYIFFLTQPSPWVAVAAFGVVAFATDFGSPAVWAFNQDIGGRHVGSVLGWGNMWGNLGAAVATPLFIWIVSEFTWNLAFLTCAAAFLISGIAALFINAQDAIDRGK